MFLNYENGRFTKNTYVKPGVYFCLDLPDFLCCIEEGTPASIELEESLMDALVEIVYNAILYAQKGEE